MNSQTRIPSNVFKSAFSVAEKLEPLKTKKDPVVAAIAGFALGGLGLGVYFKSWVDFFVPFIMLLVIGVIAIPTGEVFAIFTPVFWAIYGYRRAKSSNAKLDCMDDDVLDAEIITEPSFSPRVQIPATNSRQDREFRLRKLNELYHSGVLTPAQRDDEKKEILGEL